MQKYYFANAFRAFISSARRSLANTSTINGGTDNPSQEFFDPDLAEELERQNILRQRKTEWKRRQRVSYLHGRHDMASSSASYSGTNVPRPPGDSCQGWYVPVLILRFKCHLCISRQRWKWLCCIPPRKIPIYWPTLRREWRLRRGCFHPSNFTFDITLIDTKSYTW